MERGIWPAVAGIVARGDLIDVTFQSFADDGADFGQVACIPRRRFKRHIGKLFLFILLTTKPNRMNPKPYLNRQWTIISIYQTNSNNYQVDY